MEAAEDMADRQARIMDGMRYAGTGRYGEAVAIFDELLHDSPGDVSLLLCQAGALSRMGSFARATEAVDRALAAGPLCADGWFLKGLLFYQRGDLMSGLGYLEEALDLDRRHVEAWTIAGNCHYYLGDFKEALDCYEMAVRQDRAYPKAWYNRGVVLSDVRLYQQAIECYDEVLRINPDVAVAWTNKGYCYAMLNDYAEAVVCLDRSLGINPGDVTALNNMAAALRRMGREGEAAEYEEKARDLLATRGPHTVL